MNNIPREPDLPRIPERNLGACVALHGSLVRAIWKECGFSCDYSNGKNIPVATLVSGDPLAAVRDSLRDFRNRHDVSDESMEWMIGMVIASLQSNADYWEFLSKINVEAWESAQWMRAKLSLVKLAWLMGDNDDRHRQEAAMHAIAKYVFQLASQALENED